MGGSRIFLKGGSILDLGLQAKKGVQEGVQLWIQCLKTYIVGQKGGAGPPPRSAHVMPMCFSIIHGSVME